MDLMIKGVRWILWLLCKGCFFLVDSIYNIIRPIVTFDIASNEMMWQWWGGICLFIGVFVFIRIIAMFLKAGIDEEYRLKKDPVHIIVRVGAIMVVVIMMPMIVKYFTASSSYFIDKMGSIFGVKESFAYEERYTGNAEVDEQIKKIYDAYDGMPSQLLLSSATNGTYPPYQLININETKGGMDSWLDGVPILGHAFDIVSGLIGADGDFQYFPDTTMLIFLIVEAFVACYLFVLMAIQIGQRMFSIALKIIMSPIPISGLVNEDDKTFSLWVKLLTADLLSNILQFLLLLLVMMIISTPAVQKMGLVAQGIFFLGGMLAVIVGPSSVAQLIGGDGMGIYQTMQALQTIQTMKGITQGALSKAGSMAGATAAMGVYGIGRMIGGKSLGQSMGGTASGGNGGMNPFDPQGGSGNGAGGGMSRNSNAYKKPTEKQEKAAQARGIDIRGMNRGQVSQALENAGMKKSYWNGMKFDQAGSGKGTVADANGNYSQQNAARGNFMDEEQNVGVDYGMRNNHTVGTKGNDEAAESGMDNANMQNQNEEPFHLTREDTFARRIADKGKSSRAAKLASNIGTAMYISSGNRIMGSRTVMRGGKYVNKNTKIQAMSNIKHGIQDAMKLENDPKDMKTGG